MALDLHLGGVLIGSVVRCRNGCFAYTPDGQPVGEFADIDAAAFALAARVAPKQVAA